MVAEPDEFLIPPVAHDGSVTMVGRQEDGGPEQLIVRRGSSVLFVHTSPDGWLIDHGDFNGAQVVVVEHDDRTGEYTTWQYELDGSRRVVTDSSDTAARHTIPQVSLTAERLAWNETESDGSSCLYVLELASGAVSQAFCAPEASVRWPHLSGSALTWSEVDDAAGANCSRIRTLELVSGRVRDLGVDDCQGFQGVHLDGFTVWSQARLGSPRLSWARIYGRAGADGPVFDLGEGAAGSVVACHGRAYWNTQMPDVAQVRSWRPGEDVRIVYRSPSMDKYPTTRPSCSAAHLTIVRAYVGRGPATDEALSLDLTAP